jgi:hypothetical protein
MDIQVIETEKMQALQALANANVEVGKVRETIALLKKEEGDYIAKREKKTLERINVVLEESATVLRETLANYGEIHQFAKDATELALFLAEAYTEFGQLRDTFDEYTKVWEENMKKQEEKLKETQNIIKIDRIQVEKDREAVREAEKRVAIDRRKVRDERETLNRAINRLKNNTI